ncbi:MAG: hypothetical protein V4675_16950 [Verrucomicrobiota bacterium]
MLHRCPDLYLGGVCHSDVELEAYSELCLMVWKESPSSKPFPPLLLILKNKI